MSSANLSGINVIIHISKCCRLKKTEETYDYGIDSQDYSNTHGVEYLIEADHHEDIKEDIEERDGFCNRDDDEHVQESTDDQHSIKADNVEQEQLFYTYEATNINNENSLIHQDDQTCRDSYSNEPQHLSAELDSWLLGVKETIMVSETILMPSILIKCVISVFPQTTKSQGEKADQRSRQ